MEAVRERPAQLHRAGGPLWDRLGSALGIAAQPAVDGGPLYAVDVVPSAEVELVKENKLDFSTVTENRELVDMTSSFGRPKRHIEFALPEDVTYAAESTGRSRRCCLGSRILRSCQTAGSDVAAGTMARSDTFTPARAVRSAAVLSGATMRCLRIYATPDGESHFDEIDIPTTKRPAIPNAAPNELFCGFARIPAAVHEVGWHTVPEQVLTVRLDGGGFIRPGRRGRER